VLFLRLLYRKVKDWRRSEVILSGPSRPAKWISRPASVLFRPASGHRSPSEWSPVAQRVVTGRPASKSSRPARRRFSEVVIVSKTYTKRCAGVWERDRTRKETKKRHSRARRLHNNSSIPSNSSILCSRCLGVTKLLLHWGWM